MTPTATKTPPGPPPEASDDTADVPPSDPRSGPGGPTTDLPPKGSPDSKPGGDSKGDAKPGAGKARRPRKGKYAEPMTNLYMVIGMGAGVWAPSVGEAFISAAPGCGEWHDEMAREYPRYAEVLEKTLTTGIAVRGIVAHTPIITAIAQRTGFVDRITGLMRRRGEGPPDEPEEYEEAADNGAAPWTSRVPPTVPPVPWAERGNRVPPEPWDEGVTRHGSERSNGNPDYSAGFSEPGRTGPFPNTRPTGPAGE